MHNGQYWVSKMKTTQITFTRVHKNISMIPVSTGICFGTACSGIKQTENMTLNFSNNWKVVYNPKQKKYHVVAIFNAMQYLMR